MPLRWRKSVTCTFEYTDNQHYKDTSYKLATARGVKAIAFAAVPQIIEKGIVILPFGKYKSGENVVSAMIAAPVQIANNEYICIVVLRKRQEINKLYVHEVTIKEKLLDDNSNSATNQEVIPNSLTGSSNPTQSLATNQRDIANVLQKIISTKSS